MEVKLQNKKKRELRAKFIINFNECVDEFDDRVGVDNEFHSQFEALK